MNDEFNLLLPLVGASILFFLLIFGGCILWLMQRTGVIQVKNWRLIFSVLKGIAFSFVGVLLLVAIISVVNRLF